MTKAKKNPLIVALDVKTFDEAKTLVMKLGDSVDIYKIGSQLFTAYGPHAVRLISEMGKKIFLDLKFHDIPNTVAKAVESAMGLNVFMLTVHTAGGREMMEAAVAAVQKQSDRPFIVGVTVLTSDTGTANTSQLVLERARMALESGLDGVVASPQEAAMLRRELGSKFIIVTPGIRPASAATNDQKRIATPAEAIAAGSNYLVVGRPIVEASSPKEAAKAILKQIKV
jgi:orotidine-5'-phosphate decarboxylase